MCKLGSCRANVVTTSFVGNFQSNLQANSGQLSHDDMIHNFARIIHHYLGYIVQMVTNQSRVNGVFRRTNRHILFDMNTHAIMKSPSACSLFITEVQAFMSVVSHLNTTFTLKQLEP